MPKIYEKVISNMIWLLDAYLPFGSVWFTQRKKSYNSDRTWSDFIYYGKIWNDKNIHMQM